MRHQNVKELAEAGQAQPIALSRADRMAIVIAKYRSKECASTEYPAPKDLDHKTVAELHLIPTIGNGMQPAVDALNEVGVPTEATAGGLYLALELPPDHFHGIFCFCDHQVLWGNVIANQLAKVEL